MAAAEKSLKPFYVMFAVILVAGGAFMVRTATSRPEPLSIDAVLPLALGPRGITIGPDSAPVEILEFADFECPYCADFASVQMPDIRQRLLSGGKVRWRFLHFPLNGHAQSPFAHLAAACANEQGRFWEMHDAIYQNQQTWVASRNPLSAMESYAERVGLDRGRYASCISERRAWSQVLSDKSLGDSLHVGGTPTFFINGQQWTGRTNPTADQLITITDSLAARAARGARR